jgi:hypothetical protein
MPVPFARTQWGRGRPFPCKACGTNIVAPKIGMHGILAVSACVAVASFYSLFAGVILILIYAVVDWRFGPISRAS